MGSTRSNPSVPWTQERDPGGHPGLLADPQRRTLLAARAVAAGAEWVLALRTLIPVGVVLEQDAEYPTFSEGCTTLEALPS
ncbi:hypothetical protein [Modestobacter sp. DSM 44400]|uniref:hypothetical protein n=1 Tax=Modestobacter sp. DSM 44400 TaxID=1550230 RepID=UPI000B85BCB7|nr:hypothetical protein [Modestobacter sp. DSM 44400]